MNRLNYIWVGAGLVVSIVWFIVFAEKKTIGAFFGWTLVITPIVYMVCAALLALAMLIGIGLSSRPSSRAKYRSVVKQVNKEVNETRRYFEQSKSTLEDYLEIESGEVDRDLIEEYLSAEGCGNLLELLPEHLRADRALVRIAVANPDLEVVQSDHSDASISAPVNSPLKHASPALKQDRELVEYAISICADAYTFASEDLQEDNDLHFAAFDQYRVQHEDFDGPYWAFKQPEDKLAMYEYIGRYFHHVHNLDKDSNPGYMSSDVSFDEIDELYGEFLPEMFADWRVMCRILSGGDDWEWDSLISGARNSGGFQEHLENNLPSSLFGTYQPGDIDTYKVTNREFVLFAIKEGFPEVVEHASEELKNDKEIKGLISGG